MARRGGLRVRVEVRGIDEAIRRTKKAREQLLREIDIDVEVTTLETINKARDAAPILTGKLKEGIQIIPQDTKPLSRTWGGLAEYTRRQEYEHKTKKGFMRKAQWAARTALRERVRQTIARIGGSV